MPLMTVTEAAAAKIKQLMSEEEDVSVLRVAIQGGGCSGFQYGLGFDRGPVEGDHEFEMHGVQVVVDPFSAPYLEGAEIDYLDSIQSAGFAINNPNATFGTANFGRITSAQPMRQIQLGARVTF